MKNIKFILFSSMSFVVLLCALPLTVFASSITDTFTATAGTLLQNHTSDSGNSWSKQFGTLDAVISNTNRIRFDTIGGTVIYVSSWLPNTADYDVSADFYIAGTTADFTGIGGRNSPSSPTGYYAVLGAGNTIKLYRGGNGSPLGSQVVTANTGETHTMKLEMRGNNIRVYWDSSVVINVVVSGADIVSSAGRASMYFQETATDSTGVHIDNFSASDASVLTPGTLSEVTNSATTETMSWTNSTGGSAPVTAQLQRSPASAGTWTNVSSGTTSPFVDTGLTSNTSYDYRVAFTDASSTTVYSNVVTVTTGIPVTVGPYGTLIESESTLLHYWPMTDSSGTSTLVSPIGGVPIVLSGATKNSAGQIDGGAVSFNGTNNYGVTASNINLSQYNKIAVEALFNYSPNTGGVAWESTSDLNTSSTGFLFLPVEPSVTNSSNVLLKGEGGYNYAFYAKPTASSWHHIVTVYDKSDPVNEVSYYVDGALQTASSRPDTTNNTNNFGNNLLYLMSRGGSSLFTPGSMQHLAIYSDLSPSRILAHYQAAFPVSSVLTPGTLSEVTNSATTETMSWTNSTGGSAPVTAQLQRSPASAGTWTNVSSGTTSPFVDTGLTSNTSYDYRVAFTDASSTTVYSNVVTVTTGIPTSTYTVQLGDLWNNNYDNTNQPKQSPFSRFIFTTNAGSITVNANTTLYTTFPAYAHIGVRVNGSNLSPLVFTTNGNQSFSVALGSVGTTKTVEIIDGTQSTGGGSTSLGSFITSITYPDTASFSVQSPINSNSILFYGDSISAGGNSTNPEYQSYISLLRSNYGFNTILEGWGYRALYDDASNATKITNFVNHIANTNPTTIWLAIGTNDYGLNKWSAASFGTALANVIDGLHTSLPTTRIICQTPLVRNSESANGYGNTLSDYRTQIVNVCNARSSYTTTINGTTFLSLSDLDDGLHPTNAGFVKYANRIVPVLNRPAFSVSGPTNGLVSQASTAFTVSLAGSATFMGDQSITISDGGNGGTFSSLLGNETGSVTLTPVNTSTSFTFTYTPTSTGLKTLTFTNGQNWNNPNTTTYLVTSPTQNVTYTAGSHGSISGSASQTVSYGGNSTAVTAVPDAGYHFVNWSDSSTQNPRTDTNVTSDISVTANFAINTYSVTYTAGSHGSISGSASQTVSYGGNSTAVTAVPDAGYHFVNWSDSSTQNPRTDTNVTAVISVSAIFNQIPAPSSTGGGGGSISSGGSVVYTCKDSAAINYNPFGSSNPSLCKYASKEIDPIKKLGKPGICPKTQILTQNLKAGAQNGKYNSYTKGIVKEVKILQGHMNRLGFNAGSVDGILGKLTDGAIKRMQKFLGTKADGYIGPLTRALLNNSCGE